MVFQQYQYHKGLLTNIDRNGHITITFRTNLSWVNTLESASAHARPSAQAPIDTSGNFSAHVSGRGGQQKIPIHFLAISGVLSTFRFFTKKT